MKETHFFNNKAFFDLLEDILLLDRFNSDQISQTLNMHLMKTDSNKYFNHFIGSDSNLLDHVELRVPLPNANAEDGLLIMTINPVIDVKISDIIERFGEPVPDFVMSDLGERIAVYYCYKHPKGRINFEISEEQDKVLKVVIDRTGK
jgi:hypothetical protein